MTAIHDAVAPTDLMAFIFPPGGKTDMFSVPICLNRSQHHDEHEVVISEDGTGIHCWGANASDPEDIVNEWQEDLNSAALALLLGACQVQVIDPVWGRSDLLWDVLVEVLTT